MAPLDNRDQSNRISVIHWPDRLHDWLADSGFLGGRSVPEPQRR